MDRRPSLSIDGRTAWEQVVFFALSWEFATIGALAENLRAEAVKTSCQRVLMQFHRRWTAFGFEGELKEGPIRTLAPVHSRGLFY